MKRDEKLLLLFFGLAGFGAYLWLSKSGQELSKSAAVQLESGVQRLIDLADSTLQTIIGFEGFSAAPYVDAKGWSIGYGHYMGTSPTMQSVTRASAYDLLRADVTAAANAVKRTIAGAMTQNQFDAMVSLAYNVGITGFMNSTVARLFNQGDTQGAADAFRMWNKVQGAISPVLVSRREQERALFLA